MEIKGNMKYLDLHDHAVEIHFHCYKIVIFCYSNPEELR